MRIALIADIHANLPALEAVLGEIDARGYDSIYHLGDLVGYGPWPNETVALLRARGISGVSGNLDSTVATKYKHCGCRYEDRKQEEISHQSFMWTCAHVSAETSAYLGALPFRLDVRVFGGHTAGPTMVLVHGTPTMNTLYWTEDRPDSFCTQMAALAGMRAGDLIAFGHTHMPWHREVDGMHFVNAGSAGRPKDGDTRAAYVDVSFETGSADVNIVRVAYDVARTTSAIRESELPDELATFLESGGRTT